MTAAEIRRLDTGRHHDAVADVRVVSNDRHAVRLVEALDPSVQKRSCTAAARSTRTRWFAWRLVGLGMDGMSSNYPEVLQRILAS